MAQPRLPIGSDLIPHNAAEYPQAVGVIIGVVRALTDKPSLRLVLYDALFQQQVICYLEADQQELARRVQGNRVAVTGVISRDAHTGRPLEIHDSNSITPVGPPTIGNYRQARAALGWREGDEPAEVTIRRIRDAG